MTNERLRAKLDGPMTRCPQCDTLRLEIGALKADKAKAAEDWADLKYWRGLITWDSRSGGDGKELDRLKAYFAEETEHGDTGVR